MEGGDDLAKCPEPFHRTLWRPDGGGMATAGTIASRAYAPKPGAPARPAIVGKACQQLAGGKNSTGETLLTQNWKHYQNARRSTNEILCFEWISGPHFPMFSTLRTH